LEGWIERARDARVIARRGTAFGRGLACGAPAFDPCSDALAISVIGTRLDRVEHLLQNNGAVALHAHVRGKAPHREIALQRIDVDLDPFYLTRTF
jgi:hypothetical protein